VKGVAIDMFLDVTRRRNPKLIDVSKYLHLSGKIPPDTYVLDLDIIAENAALLKATAEQAGITLFYMTKQIGRNPLVAQHIRSAGIDKAVVVDYKEACVMLEHGLPIGNIGHLSQIPIRFLERVLLSQPAYVTVYSPEMMQEIERICKANSLRQEVLLRVYGDSDMFYEGQVGGFSLDELPRIAEMEFDALQVAGFTSFPCFLVSDTGELVPTQNIETLNSAKKIFNNYGVEISHLNMPSATCCEAIPLIRQHGGTQGEPGHALTGTTPLHVFGDQPELPAIVYVSEISHCSDKSSFFYGGGYYRRGNLDEVLICDRQKEYVSKVNPFSTEHIDYYLETPGRHAIGATVVGAFRTQIFTTRSDVAVVSGIQSGNPRIIGIFDSRGRMLNE
jgi:predicted amino acid racemase